jgi:hypothetical protein
VVHDFDKDGIGIFDMLGDGYVDLGLRLADLEALDQRPDWDLALARERVSYKRNKKTCPRENLELHGATPDEIAFLCDDHGPPWLGHRVELNALVGRQFTDWLEGKLTEHGVAKVIPEPATLDRAYRDTYESAWLNARIAELYGQVRQRARDLDVPDDLANRVASLLANQPYLGWDSAVASIVRRAIEAEDDDG